VRYVQTWVLILASAGAIAQTLHSIQTLAGTGAAGYSGDGGPAVDASLNRPSTVAAAPTGGFYIADTSNHRIRRVDGGGAIETVAGTGQAGFSGDGGRATEADLDSPHGLLVDAGGTVLFCDTRNNRVRAIDEEGGIRTVVGTGQAGYSGDGGAATEAALNRPHDIAMDASGGLLIADTNNHRIRRVVDGIIQTVVGNGVAGYSGDGGDATESALNGPVGLAVSGDALFISDRDNRRVRRVADGVIATVVGTGEEGYGGDGGAATEASTGRPRGLAVMHTGLLILADRDNHAVRMIDSTGAISTLVGTGAGGFNGDGRTGCETMLQSPWGVAVGPGDVLLIADRENNRIRQMVPGTKDSNPPAPSPDFNGDGKIDFADFLEFAGVFGKAKGAADYQRRFDLDGDGRIAFNDFLIFALAFGT